MKKLQGNSFSKSERLCSKKLIDKLFGNPSKQFFLFPLRCSVLLSALPEPVPAQLLIIVGRKNFKNAVQRNYVRRLVREAYRCNKQELYKALRDQNLSIALSIGYVSKDFITYKELEKKMQELMKAISVYILNQSPEQASREDKAQSLSK